MTAQDVEEVIASWTCASSDDGSARTREEIEAELRRSFSPESVNRIDEAIVFDPLGRDELRAIVDLLLSDVNETFAARGLRVDVTPAARDWLLETARTDPSTGARPLRRTIQRHVQDAVSDLLIRRPGAGIRRIRVDLAPSHGRNAEGGDSLACRGLVLEAAAGGETEPEAGAPPAAHEEEPALAEN